MERARAGVAHGSAVRARVQTAGRGRRAHTWSSPEGGLYLSVLIRPHVPSSQLPGLPVACALGIVDALREMGCSRAKLKWPNDVVVGASKLAGILTELGQADGEPFAVCGVGVNVREPEEEREANVDEAGGASVALTGASAALRPVNLASCLDEGIEPLSLDEMAERVRRGIVGAAEAWERDLLDRGEAVAPLAGITDAYNERLAFRGERVSVFAVDGPVVDCGVLLGVDEWGYALVENDEGRVLRLDASQASIRPLLR